MKPIIQNALDVVEQRLRALIGLNASRASLDSTRIAASVVSLSGTVDASIISLSGTIDASIISLSGTIDSSIAFLLMSLGPGRYLGTQFLTGSGTYTPTPGTRLAHVRQVAAGGGGGGANSTTTIPDSAGAGGNSGWCIDYRVTGSGGSDLTGGSFGCGSGGAGGAATPTSGTTGGDTTLTIGGVLFTAKGGTGGGAFLNNKGGPAAPQTQPVAIGMLAYYGPGLPGSTGGSPSLGLAYSGTGGSVPPFGSGGFAVNVGPAIGGPGLGYGSGGGGAVADGFSAPGAAGAAGAIIIDEFS